MLCYLLQCSQVGPLRRPHRVEGHWVRELPARHVPLSRGLHWFLQSGVVRASAPGGRRLRVRVRPEQQLAKRFWSHWEHWETRLSTERFIRWFFMGIVIKNDSQNHDISNIEIQFSSAPIDVDPTNQFCVSLKTGLSICWSSNHMIFFTTLLIYEIPFMWYRYCISKNNLWNTCRLQ